MCGQMVRAILEDRKTQTRRVVKPQPDHMKCGSHSWYVPGFNLAVAPFFVGQRLWVKETFYCDDFRYPDIPTDDRNDADWKNRMLYFRADGEDLCHQIPECECEGGKSAPWKTSIFMPRWASRITLEIVSVRVERLQDITGKDIIAEGAVERPHHIDGLGKCPVSAFDKKCYVDLKSLWAAGWDSINKKTHPWASNPWVFVLEFRRLDV